MEKERAKLLVIIFEVMIFLLIAFFFGYDQGLKKSEINISEGTIGPVNLSECGNMSFLDAVRCYNQYVKSVYNYTMREDTIKDPEDIIRNGGDCFDYTNLYIQLAADNGWKGTSFTLCGKAEDGIRFCHMVAVLYSLENNHIDEYCILDQENLVGCGNLIKRVNVSSNRGVYAGIPSIPLGN